MMRNKITAIIVTISMLFAMVLPCNAIYLQELVDNDNTTFWDWLLLDENSSLLETLKLYLTDEQKQEISDYYNNDRFVNGIEMPKSGAGRDWFIYLSDAYDDYKNEIKTSNNDSTEFDKTFIETDLYFEFYASKVLNKSGTTVSEQKGNHYKISYYVDDEVFPTDLYISTKNTYQSHKGTYIFKSKVIKNTICVDRTTNTPRSVDNSLLISFGGVHNVNIIFELNEENTIEYKNELENVTISQSSPIKYRCCTPYIEFSDKNEFEFIFTVKFIPDNSISNPIPNETQKENIYAVNEDKTVTIPTQNIFDTATGTITLPDGTTVTLTDYIYDLATRTYKDTNGNSVMYGDQYITVTTTDSNNVTNNYYYYYGTPMLNEDGTIKIPTTTPTDPTSPDTPTTDKPWYEKLWDGLSGIVGNVGGGIGSILSTLIEALGGVISGIIDGIVSLLDNVIQQLQKLPNLMTSFSNFLGSLFSWLPQEIQIIIGSSISLFLIIGLIKIFI